MQPNERDSDRPASPNGKWECPWGVLQAAGIYIVCAVGSLTLILVLGAFFQPLRDLRVAVIVAVTETTWAVVPVAFLKLRGQRPLESLRFKRPPRWTDVPLAAAAGILLAVVFGFLRTRFGAIYYLGPAYPADAHQGLASLLSFSPSMVDFVRVTIVGPLGEEIYFRAFLYPALRRHMRPTAGILVQGLLFGLEHILSPVRGFRIGRLVTSSTIGIILGLWFQMSGSILPGIVMHACYNGTATLLNRLDLFTQPG